MKLGFLSRLLLVAASTLMLSALGLAAVHVTVNGLHGVCGGNQQGNPENFYVIPGSTGNTMSLTGVPCNTQTIRVTVKNSTAGNTIFTATLQSDGSYLGSFDYPSTACETGPIVYSCGTRDVAVDSSCSNGGAHVVASTDGTAAGYVQCGGGGGGQCSSFTLTMIKFYDANADGIQNNGEAGIGGWKFRVTDPNNVVTDYTAGALGTVSFTTTVAGTYSVTELMPQGTWLPTTEATQSVSLGPTNCDGELVFGNVCLGRGGGLTLGYWSNRNGQASMNAACPSPSGMAAMLAGLTGLNLVSGNGANFNPTDYPTFQSWLLGATATNMAYMLSAQLSAMWLNVNAWDCVRVDGIYDRGGNKVGGVLSTAIVYAPGANGANAFGFITVGALITEADTALGNDPNTLSGNPDRSYQEALKNALDNANNNRNFVQGSACPVIYP